MKLLTLSTAKTIKAEKYNYLNAILFLSPAKTSGHQVCAKSTPACRDVCLSNTGRLRMSTSSKARMRKTLQYFNDRGGFESELRLDIQSVIKKAQKSNLKPIIRINGLSDIPNLAIKMAKEFPNADFCDYTAIKNTFNKNLPKNYTLVFSRKESNEKECLELLAREINCSIVFEKELPSHYKGYKVVDGDEHDILSIREKGVWIGLKAKGGKAKRDMSGFVVREKARIN